MGIQDRERETVTPFGSEVNSVHVSTHPAGRNQIVAGLSAHRHMPLYYLTTMRACLLLFCLVQLGHCCLPGPFGLGPAFGTPYYNPLPYAGGPAGPYGGYGPRVGPFRSEAQQHELHAQQPSIQAMYDEIQSVSSLNCGNFAEKCKWANTNDEELDWTTTQAVPDADRYMSTLGVQNYPEPFAGALVSSYRHGWEGGQLVSDPLPCIGNGLKVTATVWRTRMGPISEQPKLQVCSKNVNEAKFPLVNCNEFEIRNGVPMSAEVPPPNDLNSPAQIVFYGNNFVSPEGGAIFLQDIVVEGTLTCNGETLDSHQVLINEEVPKNSIHDGSTRLGTLRSPTENVGPLKVIEGLTPIEVMDPAPRTPQFEQKEIHSAQQNTVQMDSHISDFSNPSNSVSAIPTLFESCLALSCNPSDLSCKFWRSAGNNRWEIGTAGRLANPLTGIHLPPGTAQKFLVAPFLDSHVTSYTLVSESIAVPPIEDVFFCFYEYYATQGLSLSICTDKLDCFYKKNSLLMGKSLEENKKWNIRCTKLPAGSYELRVVAENTGENKGEVGFLPIRLARDPLGQQMIC